MTVPGTDGPCLRFVAPDGHRHELTLTPERARITLGRSAQADVALTWDDEVSRLHAAIEWMGTHWTILDDGLSRNGTFVNGERLVNTRPLKSGDRITVGAVTLKVESESTTRVRIDE